MLFRSRKYVVPNSYPFTFISKLTKEAKSEKGSPHYLFFENKKGFHFKTFQFLYNEKEDFYFMNTNDYNQFSINSSLIESPGFLKEGELVNISINTENGTPLTVDIPQNVILEIIHTEPGIKGNTATNSSKPATLETGTKINVPLFINEGDKIKIDTSKEIGRAHV